MSLFSDDAMELQALRSGWKEKQATIDRQAAQIEMMREALTLIALDDCCTDPALIAQKALSSVPDQALEQFAAKVRNSALDDAESALNKVMVTDHSLNTFKRCQQAIRAIKELPK